MLYCFANFSLLDMLLASSFIELKTNMKLLIIEDDKSLAHILEEALQADYAVSTTHSGKSGILLALSQCFDLILLDLTLPDVDGQSICAELRAEGVTSPLLVLSGKDAVVTKIVLLDCGADDYLTKPFSMAELRARIRALLRRNAPSLQFETELQVGQLRLHLPTKVAYFSNQPLVLTRIEYLILEYLMRHPNEIVNKYVLMEQIWEDSDTIAPNVVDVHISNIRKKIGKPHSLSLIQTAHRVGYKLMANCGTD